jgi:hypothetical protein
MKGNAKKQREADLYKHALREAREHLARWERLGKQLERTDVPDWQYVRLMRQAAVILGHLPLLTRPENIVHFFRDVHQIKTISKEVLRQRTNDYHRWVEALSASSSRDLTSGVENLVSGRRNCRGTGNSHGVERGFLGRRQVELKI